MNKCSGSHTPPVDHESGQYSSSESSEARVCAKSRSAAVLAAARSERLTGGVGSGLGSGSATVPSGGGALPLLLPFPLGVDESSGSVMATDISTG